VLQGAHVDSLLLLKALLLGIVEAASEFLPISSTGHLIIVGDFLGFTGERAEAFEIFIQLGAILAVVWIYRQRIIHTLADFQSDPAAQRLLSNLAIAFLPAAILGFFLHHHITYYLFNPVSVACALVAGGIAILFVEHYANTPRILEIDSMHWRVALTIGLVQTLSLFPGVSRSGATIMGGMVGGLSRSAATEFSFFLAIPTMFAATLFSLFKARDILAVEDIPLFGAGLIAAFLGGLAVVKFLLNYVAKHNFIPFAYYRIILGGLLLLYFHYHPWLAKAS
jgi:undecaprenyl-diphosphatase